MFRSCILYKKIKLESVNSYPNVLPGWLSRYNDSLCAGRAGDRIPAEAKFSAPVQTGPGAYLDSYTMGTGIFRGGGRGLVKWPGRGADHPPSSNAEVKEKVELYIYSPSGPSWRVLE